MTPPKVSVIIVSRGRPDSLQLCLTGLGQVSYPSFEVIVVADAGSRAGIVDPESVKLVPFETANISAARNAGADVASGDIIAFIDDDAVPEPTWLTHLMAPFAQPDVAIVGGYVIGRNGISYQWRARMAFPDGDASPFELPDDQTSILQGEAGRAIKTEGTNMAVRRDILAQLGGFDAAFAFYLDETDLNMRIAAAGLKTAVVPDALVHHGYAASDRRTAARVPRDLHQIAANTAVFQRKHSHTASPFKPRAAQRARLLRHMVNGDLMPGDVARLMRGFDAGWFDGMARDFGAQVTFGDAPVFKPFLSTPVQRDHQIVTARFWQAAKAAETARNAVAAGAVVSVYLFSLTAMFQTCGFQPDGYWLQHGGQFGKSDRRDPWFKFWSAKRRVMREHDRVKDVRVPKMPTVS